MKEKLKTDMLNLISKSDLDLFDTTEVVANLLIALGHTYIETNVKIDISTQLNDIHRNVINDVKSKGETLPNSLVRQGLLMLLWLENKEGLK